MNEREREVASGAPLDDGSASAAVLSRIEQRLQRIEAMLAPIEAGFTHARAAFAVGIDVVDERAGRFNDLEDRLSKLGALVETATAPVALSTLEKLVELARSAPTIVATAADIVDDAMARAAEDGLDLGHFFENARQLMVGLVKAAGSSELKALLGSGMLEPRALAALGQAARAIAEANSAPAPRIGLFGAMRAVRDPNVQRALGFMVQLSIGFGRALGPAHRERLPRLTRGAYEAEGGKA
ncbi:MAG: hypothetical protein RL385_3200 [Pseudomonadota bacterium]|jgi:hypothetical protein